MPLSQRRNLSFTRRVNLFNTHSSNNKYSKQLNKQYHPRNYLLTMRKWAQNWRKHPVPNTQANKGRSGCGRGLLSTWRGALQRRPSKAVGAIHSGWRVSPLWQITSRSSVGVPIVRRMLSRQFRIHRNLLELIYRRLLLLVDKLI